MEWAPHAFLEITAADNSSWRGTGWFASPDTVITAGHNVYMHGEGNSPRGWAKSIKVMPRRNRKQLPYGYEYYTRLFASHNWCYGAREDCDYGGIKIGSDLGRKTGWLGIRLYGDCDLMWKRMSLTGYPGDYPYGSQMKYDALVTRVTPESLYYNIRSSGGLSGSAVYTMEPGGGYAFGIHTHSVGGTEGKGVRITNSVWKDINWFIAASKTTETTSILDPTILSQVAGTGLCVLM